MVRRSVDLPGHITIPIHLTVTSICKGDFKPGQTVARVPLSAVSSSSGEIQVYSRDSDGNTVFRTFTTSWSSASTITLLEAGYEFNGTQWDDLKIIRFYYQDFEGVVHEIKTDDGSASWVTGELVVN